MACALMILRVRTKLISPSDGRVLIRRWESGDSQEVAGRRGTGRSVFSGRGLLPVLALPCGGCERQSVAFGQGSQLGLSGVHPGLDTCISSGRAIELY